MDRTFFDLRIGRYFSYVIHEPGLLRPKVNENVAKSAFPAGDAAQLLMVGFGVNTIEGHGHERTVYCHCLLCSMPVVSESW
jgi:hypothetical protein